MAGLGLGLVPSFAAANVVDDPMDLCRLYLVQEFQWLIKCDPARRLNLSTLLKMETWASSYLG